MKGFALTVCALMLFVLGCSASKSSDEVQQEQQERILQEGTSAIGMPAIKNFRERRLLKQIMEMRDNDTLATYTYLFSEQTGKLTFVGESVGYAIPAATQYTNPQKIQWHSSSSTANWARFVMPQADPNGLFSPTSAEGSWVMMLDKKTGKATPVYFEPRIVVSPFKLEQAQLGALLGERQ